MEACGAVNGDLILFGNFQVSKAEEGRMVSLNTEETWASMGMVLE